MTRQFNKFIVTVLIPAAITGFTPTQRRTTSKLNYQTFPTDSSTLTQQEPRWVPMEFIELLADDKQIPLDEFISTYVDGEAFTSCDDESDGLHECDFFGQYLGPTKWLHLTPAARENVDQVHFTVWKDVWSHPHGMVDVADKVSKEVLSYYNEFLQPKKTTTYNSKPSIRIKVIPASFGLEGFEDAIWEATQEILPSSLHSETRDGHQAITLIVASPDLSDPILTERNNCKKSSPQAEFASDTFKVFVDTLQDKLEMFSRLEGVSLDDAIRVQAFHPLWKGLEKMFPYPCVAVGSGVVDFH